MAASSKFIESKTKNKRLSTLEIAYEKQAHIVKAIIANLTAILNCDKFRQKMLDSNVPNDREVLASLVLYYCYYSMTLNYSRKLEFDIISLRSFNNILEHMHRDVNLGTEDALLKGIHFSRGISLIQNDNAAARLAVQLYLRPYKLIDEDLRKKYAWILTKLALFKSPSAKLMEFVEQYYQEILGIPVAPSNKTLAAKSPSGSFSGTLFKPRERQSETEKESKPIGESNPRDVSDQADSSGNTASSVPR